MFIVLIDIFYRTCYYTTFCLYVLYFLFLKYKKIKMFIYRTRFKNLSEMKTLITPYTKYMKINFILDGLWCLF